MKRKELKDCLTGLFDVMMKSENEESQGLIKEHLERFKTSGMDYSSPEDFYSTLSYKINNGLNEIAKTMHKVPLDDIKDKNKPNFIYTHYGFLEENLSELFVLKNGRSCCADKSRYVLEMYLEYSLTGKIKEFNPDIEKYYLPKFGTNQDWIDLCDGLYKLYYGKNESYLKAYNHLVQSEIRKYKHILHTWFVKFIDGSIVEVGTSWDDYGGNPLENDYADKGCFYLISKNLVKNKKYPLHKEDEHSIFSGRYCEVPKSEIEKIYKESKEMLV